MLGISTSDIKGPLSRFQNTKFEHDDFYRLMCSINNALGKPLREDVLEYSFDTWWSRLEDDVSPIIEKYKTAPRPGGMEGIRNSASTTESNSPSNQPAPSYRVVYTLKLWTDVPGTPLPEELRSIISANLKPEKSERVIRELESTGISHIEAERHEILKLERELSDFPAVIKTRLVKRKISA